MSTRNASLVFRARRSRTGQRADVALRVGSGFCAFVTAAIVFLIAGFLVLYAYPAVRFNGLGILTSPIWNLGNQYANGVVNRGGFAGAPGASFGASIFILCPSLFAYRSIPSLN
jgi:phosphate transport system permease protein